MAVAATLSETEFPLLVIAPTDECDRCGAKAYVIARMSSGKTITFCAHHGRVHMDGPTGLRATAIGILDESARLLELTKPTG